jgi:transposase
MTRHSQHDAIVATAAARRSEMAELVANGTTIPEVAKLWGISETGAYRIWKRIKDEMGET